MHDLFKGVNKYLGLFKAFGCNLHETNSTFHSLSELTWFVLFKYGKKHKSSLNP